MSVLDVEQPALMAERATVAFEDAVGKFFDEHASETVVARWCKHPLVGLPQPCGGSGLLNEYPIARIFRDRRVHSIYRDVNPIVKLPIARTL
jgi:hypothetical protein